MAVQTAQVLTAKYLNVKALCREEKKKSSQERIWEPCCILKKILHSIKHCAIFYLHIGPKFSTSRQKYHQQINPYWGKRNDCVLIIQNAHRQTKSTWVYLIHNIMDFFVSVDWEAFKILWKVLGVISKDFVHLIEYQKHATH